MDFRTFFPAERLLAKISDLPMYVEILPLKAIQLAGQLKHFPAQRRTHLKWQLLGIVIQLANLVGRFVRIFAHADLDELRCAGFEDAAEGQLGSSSRRSGRRLSQTGRAPRGFGSASR